jgi:hypothetical protein
MARAKKVSSTSDISSKRMKPALTPEAREEQLISYAIDLVEQRLLDGTASSQETTHFLKLASPKARLEREKLEEENKLLRAKTKAIENAEESSVAYKEVIAALRLYSGNGDQDEY